MWCECISEAVPFDEVSLSTVCVSASEREREACECISENFFFLTRVKQRNGCFGETYNTKKTCYLWTSSCRYVHEGGKMLKTYLIKYHLAVVPEISLYIYIMYASDVCMYVCMYVCI